MDDPRSYTELFYLCTFTDDGEMLLTRTEEIGNVPFAEVMVPFRTPDNDLYAITFYITNKANDEMAMGEMLILDAYVKENGVPK